MKRTGISVAIINLLFALFALQCFSADTNTAKLTDELSKQKEIYTSRGSQRPEGYVIDRSLLSYVYGLPVGFGRDLASLTAKDRWLDIGAGRGQAILDYFKGTVDPMYSKLSVGSLSKAQVVAVSIEDRRTQLWQQTEEGLPPNQIRYMFGKSIREYDPQEIGKFRLISDVVGGFSYTSQLSLFMEKVLNALELNGSFYTLLSDVASEAGKNNPYYAPSPFLTRIFYADGSELKACAWLKKISCVEVVCELKMDWNPPIEIYSVRKVCDAVVIPALIPKHFVAGTPPERSFQIKD